MVGVLLFEFGIGRVNLTGLGLGLTLIDTLEGICEGDRNVSFLLGYLLSWGIPTVFPLFN